MSPGHDLESAHSKRPQQGRGRTTAVVWDFDGTLVDSRRKNLNVNRAIIEEITGLPAVSFQVLSSLEHYQAAEAAAANWRHFYSTALGLSERDIDRAGHLWSGHQLRDSTPTPLFEGVPQALASLRDVPQGIVSQNGSEVISSVLQSNGIAAHFSVVIGYQEVGFERQKPAPDGLLMCVERLMNREPGCVFYVGDHETDVLCAARAREELRSRGVLLDIRSVGVTYGGRALDTWAVKPDHVARRPMDVVRIVAAYLGGTTMAAEG